MDIPIWYLHLVGITNVKTLGISTVSLLLLEQPKLIRVE